LQSHFLTDGLFLNLKPQSLT